MALTHIQLYSNLLLNQFRYFLIRKQKYATIMGCCKSKEVLDDKMKLFKSLTQTKHAYGDEEDDVCEGYEFQDLKLESRLMIVDANMDHNSFAFDKVWKDIKFIDYSYSLGVAGFVRRNNKQKQGMAHDVPEDIIKTIMLFWRGQEIKHEELGRLIMKWSSAPPKVEHERIVQAEVNVASI
eukprot:895259_1